MLHSSKDCLCFRPVIGKLILVSYWFHSFKKSVPTVAVNHRNELAYAKRRRSNKIEKPIKIDFLSSISKFEPTTKKGLLTSVDVLVLVSHFGLILLALIQTIMSCRREVLKFDLTLDDFLGFEWGCFDVNRIRFRCRRAEKCSLRPGHYHLIKIFLYKTAAWLVNLIVQIFSVLGLHSGVSLLH